MSNLPMVHWFRYDVDIGACGKSGGPHYVHSPEGFVRLAGMIPNACRRCKELAVSEAAFAHPFPPQQEEG